MLSRRFFQLMLLSLLVPMVALADAVSLYDKADSLYNLQQYDEAHRLALEALAQCNDSSDVADCSSLLALINIRQGHFEQAAQYAKRCHAIDLKSGDPDNISSSLNTLAGIYMSMRQPEEAEKYILKAISYAQKADNPQRLAILYGMASEVYHHLKQEERSLDYATKAYQMEQQLGRKDKISVRQAQRAAALISLKRHAEAEQALREAIPGLRESGNLHSLGIACNQMGLLMHQQQNDSAAVRFFNEALAIFTQQHDLFNEASSRKGLYEALRHSDPQQAMQHNDRYMDLRDSLYDKNTGELLSKYAAEYGNGELQDANNRLLENRRLFIIGGLVIIAILILLGGFIFRNMQRREQQHTATLIAQISELRQKLSETETTIESPVSDETAVEPTTHSQADTLTETEDYIFLMRLVKAVNDGLPTGHYGVEEIASQLNMSSQTFRRRLLSVTGDSPKAFISAIQMELATKLLSNHPEMPISQVANRCGYDEATSFNRIFRKVYGMTPTQYREKC